MTAAAGSLYILKRSSATDSATLAIAGPQVADGQRLPFHGPDPLTEKALEISAALKIRLDRLGLEFLADVLGIEARERPSNAEALASLGMVLTKLGRYGEGLAVDRRLVELQPQDSTAHYNLACSLALTGECAQALTSLEEAVRHGYDDAEHLESDPDLGSLREEPRFQGLLAALRNPS